MIHRSPKTNCKQEMRLTQEYKKENKIEVKAVLSEEYTVVPSWFPFSSSRRDRRDADGYVAGTQVDKVDTQGQRYEEKFGSIFLLKCEARRHLNDPA